MSEAFSPVASGPTASGASAATDPPTGPGSTLLGVDNRVAASSGAATDWRWHPERVSVVIPTYNRSAVLQRVLDGFRQQTVPAERFEVIVCDDGSTDSTAADVARYQASVPYRLELVSGRNGGPAAARNVGLQRASGEIVVFIDDDCVPTPTLLEQHVASHEVEGLAVIGRIAWHPELPISPFMQFIEADLFAYSNISVPFDATFVAYYTGNASVDRRCALAIGGFDADFPRTHEDIEFAYRLRQYGVRFVYNHDAVIWHYREMTLAGALEFQRLKGRELVRLWRKHPELADYIPFHRLLNPELQHRFYETSLTYYLMLGMQEALGDESAHAPDSPLPALVEAERQRWTDRRLVELQSEITALRSALAQAEQSRQWAEQLQKEHARLERAYQEQARWAAQLEQQLQSTARLPAARLPGRLWRALRRRPGPANHRRPGPADH